MGDPVAGRSDGSVSARAGAEASGHWSWEQDSDYRFTTVTSRAPGGGDVFACRLGNTPWEIPGALPLNATWPQHRACLDAREPFSDLRYAIFSEGAPPRYLSTSGTPVFDSRGDFLGYRGTTIDISAEWLPGAAEATMLGAAARIGHLGAWSVDLHDMSLTWSEEVRRIHDVGPGYQCTVEEALRYYIPEHREIIASAVAACTRGIPFDLELQIVTARGRRAWVRAVGEPERSGTGKIVRIRGAVQDVTRTREAAEVQRTLARDLKATLDSLTDAFLMFDAEWRFTYLNDEACRFMRRTRDDLLGRNVWAEFPDLVGTRVHEAYQRAMAGGTAVEIEDFYEPFGIWFRLKASRSAQGLAVSLVDITAQKDVQEMLRRHNAELEARIELRVQEMEALAYAIAHDLRAPLSSINGYGRMLMAPQAGELTARGRHFAERLVAAGSRMEAMIEGLLGLARLSTASLERREADLSAIAAEAVGALAAEEPDREVRVHIEEGLVADCDARHVSHVLANLLGNAWKFTSRSPAASIEVGREAGEDGEPVYFVRDNGVGFEPQYAHSLFKPFYRLHAPSDYKGTGIGLALVQRIVSLHGGRIWAESRPGQGACFRFTLSGARPSARPRSGTPAPGSASR